MTVQAWERTLLLARLHGQFTDYSSANARPTGFSMPQDPSVMAASLCALGELIARDARPYKNLIPSFVSILKQITDGKLPKAFDYHKVPAPFIQVPAASPVMQPHV
jgi:hypothetical protein